MDPQGKAQVTAVCNFLQEGASMHAETAGFGFEEMLKRNQVWVLARMKIIIDKYPRWKDQIKLNTWSRGKEGIFYLRDFLIEDEQGNVIIKASSSWAAINTKKGRPEIVENLENGLFTLKDKKAFDEKSEKLPPLENAHLLRKRIIEFTDIDLVYHVNNVKYVELIINSFSKEINLNRTIKGLEINYLGETKYGDEVSVFAESVSENKQNIKIVRDSDSKEVCRARISW